MSATPDPVHNSIKPGRWLRSTCKMCLHSCTSRIHITDDGIINKIEGDPSNPSNNGKLCPKGNSAILRHYDPNRFKQPLKRTNPVKGVGIDPGWVPISWEEAFSIVASELKKSIDQDPRKLICSIEDFQKMHTWIWGLTFGNNNCFNSNGTMCGGAYHPANGYIHRPAPPQLIQEQVQAFLAELQQEYHLTSKRVQFFNIHGQSATERQTLLLPAIWRDPRLLSEAQQGFNEYVRRRR